MELIINSESQIIPDDIRTINQLLDFKNISRKGTAVALNNNIVTSDNRDSEILNDGDTLLIISAAFGG
ncbi:MAG: sulfur carrier protein ThiS [Muribaculaceae bacterium]|nr:sulfur carrier protein ThiS [Muribaculaceae bacterium]